jgi:hypothetical protein
MRNMLTDRWVPFLSVFLVIVASAYIFTIIELIKSNRNKVFAILTIAVIFSFFMITTPGINKDNPIVAKDTTIRNQFKDDETSAAETISNVHNGTIITDSSYACSLFRQMAIKSTVESFDVDYIASNTQEENRTMILLRRCALKEPVNIIDRTSALGSKNQLLPKEFFDMFESTDYDLIYTNREVLGYISR